MSCGGASLEKNLAWRGINSPRPISVASFSNLVHDPTKKGLLNRVFKSVCGVASWAIWRWRNDIAHAEIEERVKLKNMDIFPEIQRITALWFDSCCPTCNVNLDSWCIMPTEAF